MDVTVIPMDSERILPGRMVPVRGDRTVDVGPAASVRVPAGADRIDGSGKYLLRGPAEMRGHTQGGNATGEFREQVIFLCAANGVTTACGMLGLPSDLDLKARTNTGEIWSPMLYLAGPSCSGSTVTSPEQTAGRVRMHQMASDHAPEGHAKRRRESASPLARQLPPRVSDAHARRPTRWRLARPGGRCRS